MKWFIFGSGCFWSIRQASWNKSHFLKTRNKSHSFLVTQWWTGNANSEKWIFKTISFINWNWVLNGLIKKLKECDPVKSQMWSLTPGLCVSFSPPACPGFWLCQEAHGPDWGWGHFCYQGDNGAGSACSRCYTVIVTGQDGPPGWDSQ